MERKNRIKPSPAAALALVILSALYLFAFDAVKAPAGESWLIIEEEKPVYGRAQAPKSPKADKPKPRDKGNMAEQEARLKRYLRRFTQAMVGAQQCVDDRGDSYEKLEKESAKIDAANRTPAITELRPVFRSSLAELNAYGELVKKDARFTPVDPGRNAAIKEKGDELIKLGDAMCKTAKQWAKSNSEDQRGRLKKDLDRMRQDVMRKRSALKDELNSMISLLKPIYKRLGVAYKEMTTERKQDLKQSYEVIISSILEAHKWRVAMDRKRQPFEDELQKALDAAAAIRGILDRNPKLLTQSERNNIRQQVAPERTTSQLRTDFNSQQIKLERDPAKTIEASHSELAKDPGIPMVKVALASKTLALIYSASGDTFSKGVKDAFENMQRTKDALTEIRKRSRLTNTEWRRSSDRLTEYWACINKSLKQKTKRYFSGTMKQTFSGVVAKLHKPCRSKKATCGPVRADIGVTLYVKKKEGRWQANVPVMTINAPTPRGLYCGANQNNETQKLGTWFKYDPATGALSIPNSTIYSLKGKVSGTSLAFEQIEQRTFDTDNKGCGHLKLLVRTIAKLKEVAAEGVKATSADASADVVEELEPLDEPGQGRISSTP